MCASARQNTSPTPTPISIQGTTLALTAGVENRSHKSQWQLTGTGLGRRLMDADFRSVGGKWTFHRFTGTKWPNVYHESRQIYLANVCRVLLSRALQGLISTFPKEMSRMHLAGGII